MDPNPFPASTPAPAPAPQPIAAAPPGLTKREYFAVHLFEAVTANLSMNCTMQDKVNHAVDAADALLAALNKKKV